MPRRQHNIPIVVDIYRETREDVKYKDLKRLEYSVNIFYYKEAEQGFEVFNRQRMSSNFTSDDEVFKYIKGSIVKIREELRMPNLGFMINKKQDLHLIVDPKSPEKMLPDLIDKLETALP